MVDQGIIDTVKQFVMLIPEEIGVKKAFLFGSFAKKQQRESIYTKNGILLHRCFSPVNRDLNRVCWKTQAANFNLPRWKFNISGIKIIFLLISQGFWLVGLSMPIAEKLRNILAIRHRSAAPGTGTVNLVGQKFARVTSKTLTILFNVIHHVASFIESIPT